MTALPKAAPLSGLLDVDPSAPNTDDPKFAQAIDRAARSRETRTFNKINRRLAIWSRASQRAWRTRKSMAEHREALLAAERKEAAK